MNLFNIIIANLKRYIKSPTLLLSVVVAPLALVIGTNFISNSSGSSMSISPIALVMNESGEYEKQLLNELHELNISSEVFNDKDLSLAMDLLNSNDVSSVYVLDDSFSTDLKNLIKPSIKCISNTNSDSWIKIEIDNFINNILKDNLQTPINLNDINTELTFKKTNTDSISMLGVFLPCYMMYVSVSVLSYDLISMKKSNTLGRILSTSNKSFNLLLGMVLALFLFQVIAYLLVVLGLSHILDFSMNFSVIMIVVSNCFTCTCLSILCARLFKTENSVSMAITIYAIVGVLFTMVSFIPEIYSIDSVLLNNLGLLFPFYWTLDALGDGNLLFSCFIIILMGLCFITGGSFNLRDFAKNN